MFDYSGLSFQHIQYFIVIAEQGSMSKAAETLHVSPSLLSQKISQMENLIGVGLFHRSHRKLVLTIAGQQLLADLKDIQTHLYHVLDSAREQHRNRRTLVLGFTNYQEQPSVDAFLQGFKKRFPNLEFVVEVLPRKQLQAEFMDRKIDIIMFIDFDRLRQDKKVVSRIARMYPVACYINPAMPLAQKKTITWRDLDGATCIMPEHNRNSAFIRDLKRKFNEENILVPMQFHDGDIMTINRLVSLNRYITFARFVPNSTLPNSENLKIFLMPDLGYPFLLSHHSDAGEEISTYAQAMYDIICEYFREES